MRHFKTVFGAAEAVSRSPRSALAHTAARSSRTGFEVGYRSLDRRIHATSTPIVA